MIVDYDSRQGRNNWKFAQSCKLESKNIFDKNLTFQVIGHIHLPFYHPRFESRAHCLHFYQFIFELYHLEKTKINIKEAEIGPFFKKSLTPGQFGHNETMTTSGEMYFVASDDFTKLSVLINFPGLFLIYFRSFLFKSVDAMLGIRTRGRRMVGADESTELWRPLFSFFSHVFTK